MSITGNKCQLGYYDSTPTLHTLEITKPIFPYTTKIKMALNIAHNDDGSYDIGDDGVAYDVRECECEFINTLVDHTALLTALMDDDKGRGSNMTLAGLAGAGFFPFGPDKGDAGPWDVAVELIQEAGIGPHPFKMWRDKLRFTFIGGTWPAYSFVANPSIEGVMTIGTVTNLRFPKDWFKPDTSRMTYTTVLTGSDHTAQYRNLGKVQDDYDTSCEIKCSLGKASRLIDYLTTSGRSNAIVSMALVVPGNSYPFGIDKSVGGAYTVKMVQEEITVICNNFNDFRIPLQIHYLTGPN